MEWSTSSPETPGKYIVETKTVMGNKNVLLSYWNGKVWSFNNQSFVKYLKE
jgi:glycogen debranching enzyme